MKPIPSTAEILAFKMLGYSIDKKWKDWAYDMLCVGFENENLLILAGEQEPYNQFELQHLTDKLLKELNLIWDNRELVYKNYACYLIDQVANGEMDVMTVLRKLYNIYIQQDHESYLQDFAILYWAKGDLDYSGDQYYWPGATRENIDEVIMDYFKEWNK